MQLKTGVSITPNQQFHSPGASLLAAAEAWFNGMRERMRSNATRRALADLDDHTLKDIGVPRLDIHWVARSVAAGRTRPRLDWPEKI